MKETEVINILIDLSIRSRIDGILSLQKQESETTILFATSTRVPGRRVPDRSDQGYPEHRNVFFQVAP